MLFLWSSVNVHLCRTRDWIWYCTASWALHNIGSHVSFRLMGGLQRDIQPFTTTFLFGHTWSPCARTTAKFWAIILLQDVALPGISEPGYVRCTLTTDTQAFRRDINSNRHIYFRCPMLTSERSTDFIPQCLDSWMFWHPLRHNVTLCTHPMLCRGFFFLNVAEQLHYAWRMKNVFWPKISKFKFNGPQMQSSPLGTYGNNSCRSHRLVVTLEEIRQREGKAFFMFNDVSVIYCLWLQATRIFVIPSSLPFSLEKERNKCQQDPCARTSGTYIHPLSRSRHDDDDAKAASRGIPQVVHSVPPDTCCEGEHRTSDLLE